MISIPESWFALPFLISVAFYGFFGRTSDAILLLILISFRAMPAALEYSGLTFYSLAKSAIIALSTSVVLLQLVRATWPGTRHSTTRGLGRVLLFPSRTTHSRMFPERHSFSYSYLVVGIPVGWEGVAGGMVSSGVERSTSLFSWLSLKSKFRKGWYDVDAADYLERGNRELGLRGKLDAYLKSQVCTANIDI